MLRPMRQRHRLFPSVPARHNITQDRHPINSKGPEHGPRDLQAKWKSGNRKGS